MSLNGSKWAVWINFVRDAYATRNKIVSSAATFKLWQLLEGQSKDKLRGLFNSGTSPEEAARQLEPPK